MVDTVGDIGASFQTPGDHAYVVGIADEDATSDSDLVCKFKEPTMVDNGCGKPILPVTKPMQITKKVQHEFGTQNKLGSIKILAEGLVAIPELNLRNVVVRYSPDVPCPLYQSQHMKTMYGIQDFSATDRMCLVLKCGKEVPVKMDKSGTKGFVELTYVKPKPTGGSALKNQDLAQLLNTTDDRTVEEIFDATRLVDEFDVRKTKTPYAHTSTDNREKVINKHKLMMS